MVWGLDNILGMFGMDMGIDLGTANTIVCVRGQGIVLSEPSVVAVRRGTNQVLLDGEAVGVVAKDMLGKTPASIQAVRPMKEGVIADFEITRAMLRYFINKAHRGGRRFVDPRVVVAVPSGITAVEKRAVFDSATRAGARRVYLVEEPKAAGLGAGLPVTEPVASLVVDVGGGTTEVAVLSLADVVTCQSIRVGGDDMDESIVQYMKRTYNLLIGEQMAERIKIEIGSAWPLEEEMSMDVSGRDLVAGLPRKTAVTSEEVREALRDPVNSIVDAVRVTLESTAPELSADLVYHGMTLAGGGVLLRGLDKVLEKETALPVRIADDPMTCVARGTALYLENLDLFKDTMESEGDEY